MTSSSGKERFSMRSLWSRSIKTKLMLLFTANTVVALSLACIVFWIYLTLSYRQTLVEEVSTMAQMLGRSSASALTSSNHDAAAGALAVLRADSRMESACLYDKHKSLFASYVRNSSDHACTQHQIAAPLRFNFRSFTVLEPIATNGEFNGSLLLRVSLVEMYSHLRRFGVIGAGVLFVSTGLAMLLSLRLQRLISDPILHLTHVAKRVSKGGNYSIRAASGSEDETGVLIDQFNSMMEQVSQRDLELQRAQDELEARVADRTRELQNEIAEREVIQQDLLNAKLIAEESNRAKSAFLANMSHELRTPLNAILGYSEMLEEDAKAAGNQSEVDDLKRIESAGRHLLMLINDVLDLSKIEAGRVELFSEPAQVGTLVNDIVSTIEPLARKNKNVFLASAEDANATIYVDVTKFRQCLLNLLSNACKFTEGGIVRLRVEERARNGDIWSCWEVSDTGIGIADSDQAKLFQAFSQVDSSATRRHGGTGLGLAISQRLTRMMGGWIECETQLGRGSTFTIYLPRVAEGEIARTTAAARVA
jgi:signal transduction histidine kinase